MRRISFATTDLALMALILHHHAVRVGTRDSHQPEVPLHVCTYGLKAEKSHAEPKQKDTKRCVLPLDPSLSASRIPPAHSPCPSPPRPPSPPEDAPPPTRCRWSQRDGAASIHPAASGSGQVGTSFLRAGACAPSRSRAPISTKPPQYQAREGERERERKRERYRKRERRGVRDGVCVRLLLPGHFLLRGGLRIGRVRGMAVRSNV